MGGSRERGAAKPSISPIDGVGTKRSGSVGALAKVFMATVAGTYSLKYIGWVAYGCACIITAVATACRCCCCCCCCCCFCFCFCCLVEHVIGFEAFLVRCSVGSVN
ncbi:hypothetical protein J3Q64DRAFT_1752113, partial [Phycomyces blakesleeanus]